MTCYLWMVCKNITALCKFKPLAFTSPHKKQCLEQPAIRWWITNMGDFGPTIGSRPQQLPLKLRETMFFLAAIPCPIWRFIFFPRGLDTLFHLDELMGEAKHLEINHLSYWGYLSIFKGVNSSHVCLNVCLNTTKFVFWMNFSNFVHFKSKKYVLKKKNFNSSWLKSQ